MRSFSTIDTNDHCQPLILDQGELPIPDPCQTLMLDCCQPDQCQLLMPDHCQPLILDYCHWYQIMILDHCQPY